MKHQPYNRKLYSDRLEQSARRAIGFGLSILLCATSVPLAYCQPVDANSEKTNQNPQELNSTLALSADEKVTAGEKPSDPPESTPPSKIQSDENQSASSRNSGKRESAATKVDNASGDTTTKSSDTDISTETDTNAGTSDSTILDRFDLGRPGGIFAPRSPARDSLLKGTISTFSGRTPLLSGSVQVVPVDTKIELVIPDGVYINSEVSQKGDEIMVRIGKDVLGEGGKVVLPGGWYARGLITQAACQRRLGRDGYLDIKFDKLVSPDGEYEVDFDAQFSTKDSKLKSVAKVVAIDSGYVGVGSAAGALISVQMTGISGAIATNGYSVAIGAGIGATIGLIGALKRKGNVSAFYGGDVLKLVTDEPISLPAFDPEMLPSSKPTKHLSGLELKVNDFHFRKTPWKDKKSRLLELDLTVQNQSKRNFHFFDLMVESDNHQQYTPFAEGGYGKISKLIKPQSNGSGKITFLVGSHKSKYSLVFLSRRNGEELSRVPIN